MSIYFWEKNFINKYYNLLTL